MGMPHKPNQGYCDMARAATQMVEEYWDACLARLKDD